MLTLPYKEGLRISSWVKEEIQAMNDQNVDFGEAPFVEDVKLK